MTNFITVTDASGAYLFNPQHIAAVQVAGDDQARVFMQDRGVALDLYGDNCGIQCLEFFGNGKTPEETA